MLLTKVINLYLKFEKTTSLLLIRLSLSLRSVCLAASSESRLGEEISREQRIP